MTRTIASYGSWKSPITSDLIVAGTIGLSDVLVSGDDIYWIESRPSERGRRSIQRWTADGAIAELTPPEFNVRSRVHEYGGASYEVAGETIFFQNFADQLLYRHDPDSDPRPITTSGIFYGDFRYDPSRERLFSIQEDHGVSDIEAINTLVTLDPHGPNADGGETIVSGSDFVAGARLSPDGRSLAWLEWNHPHMPWDAAALFVGDMDQDGVVRNRRQVAGGDGSSVVQPEWTPGGDLIFVDDRTGWWNFYRYRDGQVDHLLDMEAEFGRPLWAVGATTYAVVSNERVICAYTQNGFWAIGDLNLATGEFIRVPTPYTEITSISAEGNIVAFTAGNSTSSIGLYRHDLSTGDTQLIRSASSVSIDPDFLSAPTTITFPTSDDQVAHAFLYMPRNPDFDASEGQRPPLIVASHGGPTSAALSVLDYRTQFWTSRGFAFLDVNYRGSTGFGRPYRDALQDTWGIYDVDDCVYGAQYLVEKGVVDGEKLAVRGGSASGYLTLAALTFRDTFKAGCALYGISNLEIMAIETHKFESRYLDGLVGPYPACVDIYRERSPLYHIDQLNTPLILFHGLEDKVVPPNQSELIYEALKEKGVPVAMVLYEGEQHGFRQAANIKRTLDGELYFYSRIFGFEPADPIEPVPIANLD